MFGLDRVWNAIQPGHLGATLGGLVDQLRDKGAVVGRVATVVGFDLRDRLELATGHTPKGPFPSMTDLQKKFPRAGLPDRMVGTTIDDQALAMPGMTPDKLMDRAKAMGFNTVRLGAYWNQIQPTKDGQPNFAQLDALLAAAQKRGIRVVLTVGAKAPSWPEYQVPTWAAAPNVKDPCSSEAFRQSTERFVGMVAKRYADNAAIAMWQVENEPFDPSGPKNAIMRGDEVTKEAALLRKADGGRRPLLINVWSDGDRRPQLEKAFQIADIVGLDVYKHSSIAQGAFERTVGLPLEALRLSKQTGKPAMIAELQADNWGPYKANAADTTALAKQLEGFGYRDMLFWRLAQNLKDDRAGRHGLADAETQLAHEALGQG